MHLRTPLALLLGSALLLTGCGAEDEPEPKFEAESTPTPTVAKEETAEDFIRRWNDEQARMQEGDTAEYRRIAGQCKPCMKTADRIDKIYADGGFVKTDGRKVRSIEVSDRSQNVANAYLVEVDSAPTVYKESSEAPEEELKGGASLYELRLAKKDGEWRLVDTWAVPL